MHIQGWLLSDPSFYPSFYLSFPPSFSPLHLFFFVQWISASFLPFFFTSFPSFPAIFPFPFFPLSFFPLFLPSFVQQKSTFYLSFIPSFLYSSVISFLSSFLFSFLSSLSSFVVVLSRDLLSSLRVCHSLKTRLTRRSPAPKGAKKGTSLLPLPHADGIALTTLRIHVGIPNCCRLGVVSTCFPSSSLSLLALWPVMSWFWFSPPATGMFFIPSPSSILPLAFCGAARPLFSSPLSPSRTFQVFLNLPPLFFFLLFVYRPINHLASFPWLLLAPTAASSHSHLRGVKNA